MQTLLNMIAALVQQLLKTLGLSQKIPVEPIPTTIPTVPKPPVKPTPVKPEPTPVKPEPTPVKPEPTPVKPEPTPAPDNYIASLLEAHNKQRHRTNRNHHKSIQPSQH